MPFFVKAGATLAALGLIAFASSVHAQELVTNGGFETGDFSGWTQSGNLGFTGVVGGGFSGAYSANFGPIGSLGFIEQNLATNAGSSYTLDFYLANDGGTPNEFETYIDGSSIISIFNAPGQPFTEYSYNFTASGSSTNLKFGFQQNPAWWHLDDVSVTAASAVPEPGVVPFAILATGSIMGLVIRNRRKA